MANTLPASLNTFTSWVPYPVVVLGADHMVIGFSEAAKKEWGEEVDVFVSKHIDAFIQPDGSSSRHHEVLKGQRESIEVRILIDPVRTFRMTMIKDGAGPYVFLRFVALDIENPVPYHMLIQNSLEAIVVFNDRGDIVQANPSAQDMFSLSQQEIIKSNIFDLFPDTPYEEKREMFNVLRTEGIVRTLYRYTKDEYIAYIDAMAKAYVQGEYHVAWFANVTERHMISRALRDSEANLKALFNNTKQSIVLVDRDYKIIMANTVAHDRAKQVLGMEVKTGDPVQVYTLPENRRELLMVLSHVSNGHYTSFDHHIITPDGKSIWYEFSFTPIFDKKKKVSRICIISSDITYRKNIELTLSESEKRFRSLSENSPDIIYIIDNVERKVIYFNRSSILGYASGKLLDPDVWESIVHPDDKQRTIKHWADFLKKNDDRSSYLEYRLQNASGEYEWVVNRHRIIERDKERKPVKILLNLSMISERKIAEEALQQSQLRLKSLVDNTTDMIWSVDASMNVTVFNSAFRNYFLMNYYKEVHLGHSLEELLEGEIKTEWVSLHRQALKGHRFTFEYIDSRTKPIVYLEMSFNPIMNDIKQITGISVFARDITRRKQVENEIIRANFELDSFVYRASHDLRAPLRSVLGLVNLLRKEQEALQLPQYLNMIENSVNKLDGFIQDLTYFSRNNRTDLEVAPVDFEHIIKDVIANLRFMDEGKSVDVSYDLQMKEPFHSDGGRLTIVLQNVISNAIKYLDKEKVNPFVRIRVGDTPEGVQIEVEDNGIGIEEQYKDRIFEMFFRASERSYGSGLGLYITRQVVDKLNGNIRLDSKAGRGTNFMISLPDLVRYQPSRDKGALPG